MFERYTDEARRVFIYAQEAAREADHSRLGTEHLLLGLIRVEQEARAAKGPLAAAGAYLDAATQRASEITSNKGEATGVSRPFTSCAKKAVDRSQTIADQRGDTAITPIHLLLGLLADESSTAVTVLSDLGLDLAQLSDSAKDVAAHSS